MRKKRKAKRLRSLFEHQGEGKWKPHWKELLAEKWGGRGGEVQIGLLSALEGRTIFHSRERGKSTAEKGLQLEEIFNTVVEEGERILFFGPKKKGER